MYEVYEVYYSMEQDYKYVKTEDVTLKNGNLLSQGANFVETLAGAIASLLAKTE